MMLQYALDLFSVDEAIEVLKEVHDVIDIAEMGTPMILHYGTECVRRIREAFPDLTLLADMKICDGGEYEADLAFEAGADIVTVMGFTNDETIEGVVRSAKKYGKKSFVDMMRVEHVGARSREVVSMGVDYVCIHNATDALNMAAAMEHAEETAKEVEASHVVIAGGINPETIGRVAACRPEIMVVGTSITKALNRREMILKLRELGGM